MWLMMPRVFPQMCTNVGTSLMPWTSSMTVLMWFPENSSNMSGEIRSPDDVGSAIHMTVAPASIWRLTIPETRGVILSIRTLTMSGSKSMANIMFSVPMVYPAVVIGPHERPHMCRSSGIALDVSSTASTILVNPGHSSAA